MTDDWNQLFFNSITDCFILLQCEWYEPHHILTLTIWFSFSPQVGSCLEDITTCMLPNPVLPACQVLPLNMYVFCFFCLFFFSAQHRTSVWFSFSHVLDLFLISGLFTEFLKPATCTKSWILMPQEVKANPPVCHHKIMTITCNQ